jgi:hypothetical protein
MCACAHFICQPPFRFQGARTQGLQLGAPICAHHSHARVNRCASFGKIYFDIAPHLSHT